MNTLVVGLLVALVCFGPQAGPKPKTATPGMLGVCVAGVDVRLGDSFEKVSKAVDLAAIPTADVPEFRATGDETAFSTRGPEYRLADGLLRSDAYCVFDGSKRLVVFTVAWTYDGRHDETTREAIFDTLVKKAHPCLDGGFHVGEDFSGARFDGGTYSCVLRLVLTTEGWRGTYTAAFI